MAVRTTALGGRTEIVQAKLEPPVLGEGLVRRSALVNRLVGSQWTPFVQVTAPAGYGKTTLLAQWASRDARPFAWVTLDRRDNDPRVLLEHVAEALRPIAPLGDAVHDGLASRAGSIWAVAVPRLGAALAAVPEPFVLVLDDVHELRPGAARDAVVALAEHLPRGSQLALAGRGAPFPTARWRATRQLFELHAADLALTRREADTLLRSAGLDLAEEDAAALHVRSEGWAGGLYLAARSLLAGPPDPGARVFGADDPYVADYLREEHLAHLSPAELRFLTRSSVLEPMTAPLCDAVLRRTDSAGVLRGLEAASCFVVAPDRDHQGYRYHGVFRELLRAELDRREPAVAARLNRRAAAWCEAHGDGQRAVDYALAGGDLEGAARLAGELALPTYNAGRVASFERWLHAFEDPLLIDRHPLLAIHAAWVFALLGRPAEADRWANAVDRAELDARVPDGTSCVRPLADVLRAAMSRNGVEQVPTLAASALEQLGPLSPWRPSAMLLLGIGHLLNGQEDPVEAMLDDAVEAAMSSSLADSAVLALSERALLHLSHGEHRAAEHDVVDARALVDAAPHGEYLEAAILFAAGARVALVHGNVARARDDLARAERVRPLLTYAIPWFAVQVQLELGRAYLGLGDSGAARVLLAEAEDVERRRPGLGTLSNEIVGLRRDIEAVTASSGGGWASTLTAAELRLLPLLATHLNFREIGERLFISRNTVKTQAISVYRKLGASSRSGAIERAAELGLVDATSAARSAGFTRSG